MMTPPAVILCVFVSEHVYESLFYRDTFFNLLPPRAGFLSAALYTLLLFFSLPSGSLSFTSWPLPSATRPRRSISQQSLNARCSSVYTSSARRMFMRCPRSRKPRRKSLVGSLSGVSLNSHMHLNLRPGMGRNVRDAI